MKTTQLGYFSNIHYKPSISRLNLTGASRNYFRNHDAFVSRTTNSNFLTLVNMKLLLLLGLFSLTRALAVIGDQEEWNKYKMKYHKAYSSKPEEYERMMIFLENVKEIEQHNQNYNNGFVTYTKAINQYSDRTSLELKKMMSGFAFPKKPHGTTTSNSLLPLSLEELPTSVNWMKEGAVSPVRDQENCLSCWIFSAVGAVEGHYYIKTKELVTLSIQNVADCCGVAEDSKECPIGWMDTAFEYIKNNGINTEEAYPYEAKIGECRFNKDAIAANISGYVDLPPGDEAQLMVAVATKGPVSVAIDALTGDFFHYSSGIFFTEGCKNDEDGLNHAVLVVGYGEENGEEYWLIKNSWGTTWGEEGFGKIAKNKSNHCGIATKASYPTID